MKTVTTKEITTKYSMTIDHAAMVDLLRKAGHDVPDNVSLLFHVPTGGDYSGMKINLDEAPLHLSFSNTVLTRE